MEKISLKDKLKNIQGDIPIDEGSLAKYVELLEVQLRASLLFADKFKELPLEEILRGFKEGKPAFLSISLKVSEEDLLKSYGTITSFLRENLPETEEPIERIEASRRSGEIKLSELTDALMSGNEDRVHEAAEKIQVDPEMLEAILAWSIQPVFEAFSHALSSETDFSAWQSGRCPVCGGPSRLEFIDTEGLSHLRCQFCGAEWSYPENKCPYCGNEEAETI
ncbi:MAG: formate dehydrogenase accessory protein FdhE, partial [Thermofilum sp.]|nr:formate dehydrogenase accessory protein FdhE [Thermofilum sp.]